MKKQVTNIEKQLREIGNYFKQKVLKGDYKIVDIDEYNARVKIDETHQFDLWIANDDYGFEIKAGTILKPYLKFTKDEKKIGYKKINEITKNIKKQELQKRIKELQKEIEKLK